VPAQALKFAAIALVMLSLVLAIAGYRITSAERDAAVMRAGQAPNTHNVVIALRDLAAGDTLKSGDLAVVALPIAIAETFSEAAPLHGRTLRRNVFAAELLRESTFEAGGTLARETAPGMRAVAVKVDEIIAAGGFLQPGDRVDVYYAVRSINETGAQSLARLMVRGARILAFGDSISPQSGNKSDSDKRSRSAVLEVEPAIVSQLLLAETTGALRLAAIGEREADASTATAAGQDQRVSLQDLIAAPRKIHKAAPQQHSGIEIFQGDQKQLANTR